MAVFCYANLRFLNNVDDVAMGLLEFIESTDFEVSTDELLEMEGKNAAQLELPELEIDFTAMDTYGGLLNEGTMVPVSQS